ncbi:MAG: sterol desaturase family protein [Ectothiorhodospiraceae bacterium]|jgi:sterol desaturase/sphingolipid hydroxylase (fatty acid hydroxylase superfamily)
MLSIAADMPAAAGVIFALFYGHYLVIAGLSYLTLWRWGPERYDAHRIQRKPLRRPRPLRELGFSTLSIALFTVLLTGLWFLTRLGLTAVYTDIGAYGWGWFAASIAIMALVHDSYYYWAHRFMHHPRVFRHVHKLHHGFVNPTPFASYAFHPWEAIVEVAWVAPLAFVMPVHPLAFAGYILFLTVFNVVSHLGYEFYPAWIGKWFITSTHHNMHHTRGRGHYMLYFNIWDALMGTNADDYEAKMRDINARIAEARSRRRQGVVAPE